MIVTYEDHGRFCVKIREPCWLIGVTDLTVLKHDIEAACTAYCWM